MSTDVCWAAAAHDHFGFSMWVSPRAFVLLTKHRVKVVRPKMWNAKVRQLDTM